MTGATRGRPAFRAGCDYIVTAGRLCPKCGHRHSGNTDLLRAVLTVLEVSENERVAAVAKAAQTELPPMALSNKEKQEAYRQRRAEEGLQEVRGIFLPPDQHAELKEYARKLAKKRKPAITPGKDVR